MSCQTKDCVNNIYDDNGQGYAYCIQCANHMVSGLVSGLEQVLEEDCGDYCKDRAHETLDRYFGPRKGWVQGPSGDWRRTHERSDTMA